ncbi:transposase [Lishizhenia tianjinensis]|nr:transposase [Lishizhenia tianjinensis]
MVQKIRKVMGEVNLKAYFSKRSAIEVGIEKECDYFSVFYGKQVAGGLDFIRLEIPQYLHNRYRRMSTELRGKESFRNKKILLSRFKVYEIYPKYLRKSIESRTLYKNWERKILSNFLRELKGVFHHVSFMYLQNVLDEYCFKYNFRYGKEDKFRTLIRIASESS